MALVVPVWETFESPHVCKHVCTNTVYSDISFAQLMFVSWFKWDTRDCLDEYENEIQEEEAFMVNEVVLFCVNAIYLWLTLTVAFCSLRDAVNSALTWLLLTAPSALNSMKVSSCLLPPAAALRTDQAVKRNVQSSRKVSFTPFIDLSKCSQLLPNVHMIYYPCLRENENKRDWSCVFLDTSSTPSTTTSKAHWEMSFSHDIEKITIKL